MKGALWLLAAVLAFAAFGCGGDKPADDRDGDRPAATATAEPDETSRDDAGAGGDEPLDEVNVADDGDGDAASLLSPFFSLGLGGATGGGPSGLPGAQTGSGDLEQYLLTADDLPPGYESMGVFSMRMPESGAQEFPGGEFAMSMWATDDFAGSEIPDGSMLMVAVMRPDDPAAIEDFAGGCGGFDEGELTDALDGGGPMLGIEFKDVAELDSTGLGDQACGIAMTLDMSGFFENLMEGFGDAFGEEMPPEVLEAFSAFQMRMRFFGEGDKLGMVMQMGFGADAELIDDLALAQKLRANLR
jgi:hypothetical protein